MSSEQPYIVSARKYRPATFKTVVGQRALTATLKNAINGGKLAQAYLFCGPRGVGKTSCARIFAKTINCMHPTSDGEACGECESCKAIDRGNSFNLLELDAASNNSVENIRNISEQVNISPQNGRYRVFIIDEVHMLSTSAFNAFLKTLEEPPKNVVFILATTERHKVIPTILSRCQVYDFRRITIKDIIDHLAYVADEEGIRYEKEALGVIALKADGAMRDALSIFDQVAASTGGNITYAGVLDALNVLDQEYYFQLVDYFIAGDVASSLLAFKEISDKGFDAQFFINGLAEHIRNLMVCADPKTVTLLETSEELARRYCTQAPKLPLEWYYGAIRLLNDADYNYRTSGNKRLLVELTLIRLCRLNQAILSDPVSKGLPKTDANSKASSGSFQHPDGSKPQPAPVIKQEANTKINPSGISGATKEVKDAPKISPVRGGNNRPSSFRLSDSTNNKKEADKEKPRDSVFTYDELKRVWEEYAAAHPEQRILTAAMRTNLPERIDDLTYKVTTDHPAQKQAFESSLNSLMEFIKEKLNNDGVILKVEISEKAETAGQLNPKEMLKKVVENNSELADFLKYIDAELE